MLLNNEWINNEIKNKIKTYLETNKNNTTFQNPWDTKKANVTGKFILLQACLKENSNKQSNFTLQRT